MEAAAEEIRDLRHASEAYKDREEAWAKRIVPARAQMWADEGADGYPEPETDVDANCARSVTILRDKDPNCGGSEHVNGEKITFLAVCGKDAVAKAGIKAGEIVKKVSAICRRQRRR